MHETKGFQEWKQLVDCYMICLLDGESLGLSSLVNHLFVLVMYICTSAWQFHCPHQRVENWQTNVHSKWMKLEAEGHFVLSSLGKYNPAGSANKTIQ